MNSENPADGASPFGPSQARNPYQASVAADTGHQGNLPATRRPLPIFVMVVMIIGIVLCAMRLLLSAGEAAIMGRRIVDDPLELMDVLLSLIIVGTGIVANALILAKQPSGLQLAIAHVVAVVISIGVSVFQIFNSWSAISGFNSPLPSVLAETTARGIWLILRVAFLAIYIAALMRFRQWQSGR